MAHIAICGAGGWGTALAVMASRYGQDVTLWSPFEEEIEGIRRHGEQKKLLPGIPVPPGIRLTTDLACTGGVDPVSYTHLELLEAHPALYKLDPAAFSAFARENGLWWAQAHPFRPGLTRRCV